MNHKTIDRTVYGVIGNKLNEEVATLTESLEAFKSEVGTTYATKESTASAYNYCDSVATYDLLPQDAKKGDVYNVQTDGMNYAWDGAEWDELGMIIDLDSLALKKDTEAAIALKVDQSAYDIKVAAIDSRVETVNTTLEEKKLDKTTYDLDKQLHESESQQKLDVLQKTLEGRIDELGTTQSGDKEELSGSLESLQSSLTEQITQLQQTVTSEVQTQLSALQATVEQNKSDLEARIAALETELVGTKEKLDGLV